MGDQSSFERRKAPEKSEDEFSVDETLWFWEGHSHYLLSVARLPTQQTI
jgi:hypothetical protein